MSLTWVIIVVALVAAFGPLLWMMPSRSDRRLSKMRTRARSHGIQVEITQTRRTSPHEPHERVNAAGVKLEPKVMCAAYRLGMRRLARAAPQWKILRKAAANSCERWTDRRLDLGDEARRATRRTGKKSEESYAKFRPTTARVRGRRERSELLVARTSDGRRRRSKCRSYARSAAEPRGNSTACGCSSHCRGLVRRHLGRHLNAS